MLAFREPAKEIGDLDSSSDDDKNDESDEVLLPKPVAKVNGSRRPMKNLWGNYLQEENISATMHSSLNHRVEDPSMVKVDLGVESYHRPEYTNLEEETTAGKSGTGSSSPQMDAEDGEINSEEEGELAKEPDPELAKAKREALEALQIMEKTGLPKKFGREHHNQRTRVRKFSENGNKHGGKKAKYEKKYKKPTNPIHLAKQFQVGQAFILNHRGKLEPDMEESDFVAELCYRLREPNKALILDLVRCIGFEKSIKIYNKTEQIEKDGGLPATFLAPKIKSPEHKEESYDTLLSKTSAKPDAAMEDNPTPQTEQTTQQSVAKIDENQATETTSVNLKPKPARRKTSGGIFISLVTSHTDNSAEVQSIRNRHKKLFKDFQKQKKWSKTHYKTTSKYKKEPSKTDMFGEPLKKPEEEMKEDGEIDDDSQTSQTIPEVTEKESGEVSSREEGEMSD